MRIQREYRRQGLILLAAAALLGGCASEKTRPLPAADTTTPAEAMKTRPLPAADTTTPAEAILKVLTAVQTSDTDTLVASIYGTELEIRSAKAAGALQGALRGLKEAVTAAYGQDAWSVFEDDQGAKLSVTNTSKDLSQIFDDLECTMDGDEAVALVPSMDREVHLKKIDGQWRVNAADILTSVTDERSVASQEKIAAFLDAKRATVGQPGVTPASLDAEISTEIVAILTQ